MAMSVSRMATTYHAMYDSFLPVSLRWKDQNKLQVKETR